MQEILNSIGAAFKGRMANPIYGTFGISWIVVNWKFFVTLFFVSEDKIWSSEGILKIDYICQSFFNFSNWQTYIQLLLPFFITWLVIFVLPNWILVPAFRKEEQYQVAKKRIRIEEQKKLQTQEINLGQKNLERLEVIAKTSKEEKEIKKINPAIQWKNEFEEFSRSSYYRKFELIIESVYTHESYISHSDNFGDEDFRITKDILAYCHSNDLVTIETDRNKIKLTDKGKFFVKEYSLGKS